MIIDGFELMHLSIKLMDFPNLLEASNELRSRITIHRASNVGNNLINSTLYTLCSLLISAHTHVGTHAFLKELLSIHLNMKCSSMQIDQLGPNFSSF